MSPQHDGVRTETRTRFIEGEGHLVEEVIVGTPVGQGQSVLPGTPVVVTLADVPLSLAIAVCAANGMLAVPESFLNEEQLAELKLNPADFKQPEEEPEKKTEKLTVKQAIQKIKVAATFEELNAITNSNTSADVLAAAETRAAELKG